MASWNWSNYLHKCCPANKRPLRINLDETSVKISDELSSGNVSAVARQRKRSLSGLFRKVKKSNFRSAYTYVSMICDQAEIQQILPHVIVLSSKLCAKQTFDLLQAEIPQPIRLWRRKSSWLTIQSIVEILGILEKALKPFLDRYQPILMLDSAKIHLNTAVWRKAAKCRILMHVIPPSVTYAMQPLDVYAFASVKGKYKLTSQEQNIANVSTHVDLQFSVKSLAHAIRRVILDKPWGQAFDRLGYAGSQANVSKRLLAKMGMGSPPASGPAVFPTLTQLQLCFPTNYAIPVASVFEGAVIVTGARQPPRLRLVRLGGVRSSRLVVARVPFTASGTLGSPLASLPTVAHPVWLPRLHRLPGRGRSLELLPSPPLPPPRADPPATVPLLLPLELTSTSRCPPTSSQTSTCSRPSRLF